MPEKRAQILEVAQAIGNQLEISELLASLNQTLTPIVHFDAIAIVIRDGDTITTYWGHVEGVSHRPGESVEALWIVTHRASRLTRLQCRYQSVNILSARS